MNIFLPNDLIQSLSNVFKKTFFHKSILRLLESKILDKKIFLEEMIIVETSHDRHVLYKTDLHLTFLTQRHLLKNLEKGSGQTIIFEHINNPKEHIQSFNLNTSINTLNQTKNILG